MRAALGSALTLALVASSWLLVGTPGLPGAPLVRAGHAAVPACEGPPGWVTTWASAVVPLPPTTPFAPGFVDQTLRQVVHTSAGGTAVRVTIAGPADGPGLRVASASVAVAARPSGTGADVLPGTLRPLTFGGADGVIVAPGERVTSDPIDLLVPDDHDLAVSLHFSGPTGAATGRMFSGQTSWVGQGDLVGVEGSDGFVIATRSYPSAASYFLASVDVLAEGVGGVVVLGDSVSDGYGFVWPADAETVAADRLYDRLAERSSSWPADDGSGHRRSACVAVANVAIAGNALLPFFDGPVEGTGLERLDRDVLARPGLRVVVVLLGINDLVAGQRRPEEIVAALAQVVDRAHAAGVAVVGATLPPIADAHTPPDPTIEAHRQAVNQRIRPGRPDSLPYDAVVDVDAALRQPSDPALIDPAYAGCAFGLCGRWHPGPAGHEAVAAAYDLGELLALVHSGPPDDEVSRDRAASE